MKSQGISKAGEMDWRENTTIIKIGKKTYLVVPENGKPNDIEEVLSSAIQQAIAQERERIVKSLRMEHEEPDIQAVRDVVTLNEGNVDFREVMDLEWLRIRYKNEAVDELNKKLDELLK